MSITQARPGVVRLLYILFLSALFAVCNLPAFVAGEGSAVIEGEYVVKLTPEIGHRMRLQGAVAKDLGEGLVLVTSRTGRFSLPGKRGADSPNVCAALLASKLVELCSPNTTVELLQTEPLYPEQVNLHGAHGIGADQAWTSTRGNGQIVIAVLDTGVDLTHTDLTHARWANPGEIPFNNSDDDGNGFVDDVEGVNTISSSAAYQDDHGHGTHVAGIMVANDSNRHGIAGVAPLNKILPVKILASSGSGDLASAVAGINYVIDLKNRGFPVSIINSSWGSTIYSAVLEDAIWRAHTAGILFIAAAGNSARSNSNIPMYPASLAVPNLLSVGALDKKGRYAGFSNFGASVSITAPGVSIWSTVIGNGYSTRSGTSMAAPHVAAAASLLWSINPSLSVSQVRDRVIATGRFSATLLEKMATGRALDVWGLLQSEASLPEVLPPAPLPAPVPPEMVPQPAPPVVTQPPPVHEEVEPPKKKKKKKRKKKKKNKKKRRANRRSKRR